MTDNRGAAPPVVSIENIARFDGLEITVKGSG